MKLGKALIIAFVLTVIVVATMLTAKEPTQEPDPVSAALGGCENWTRNNSDVAVGTVVDRYKIDRKVKAGHYLVGIDWRTAGNGYRMSTECEYSEAETLGGIAVPDGQLIFENAKIKPGR